MEGIENAEMPNQRHHWSEEGFRSEVEAVAFGLLEAEGGGDTVILSLCFPGGYRKERFESGAIWRGLMQLTERMWISVYADVRQTNTFVVVRSYLDHRGNPLEQFQDTGLGRFHKEAARAALLAHVERRSGQAA